MSRKYMKTFGAVFRRIIGNDYLIIIEKMFPRLFTTKCFMETLALAYFLFFLLFDFFSFVNLMQNAKILIAIDRMGSCPNKVFITNFEQAVACLTHSFLISMG